MKCVNLIYPSAADWMWNYCVYLGPYESTGGEKYDLGVYKHPDGSLSAAIVFGDEPGAYASGEEGAFMGEAYIETFKRAHIAGM